MKKIMICCLTCLTFTIKTYAQELRVPVYYGNSIAIGPEADITTSVSDQIYRGGLNGSVKVEVIMIPSLNLTASVGYTSFYENQSIKNFYNGGSPYPNYNFIPVKAGLKYYFGQYFYTEGEFGAAYTINSNNNSKFGFLYAPGAGVSFPAFRNKAIDLGIRYEVWDREANNAGVNITGFWGFKAAYKFSL